MCSLRTSFWIDGNKYVRDEETSTQQWISCCTEGFVTACWHTWGKKKVHIHYAGGLVRRVQAPTFKSAIQIACSCSLNTLRCKASPGTELKMGKQSSSPPGLLSISWDEALCSCRFCISILITEYKLFLANVKYAYSFTDSSLFFHYKKN